MIFDGRLLGGVGVIAAVVETGNFARAGDALGLTQSGVSRAIARLEMRIGVRRAVTLTDEGRRFHQSVVPLLTGLRPPTRRVRLRRCAAGCGSMSIPSSRVSCSHRVLENS